MTLEVRNSFSLGRRHIDLTQRPNETEVVIRVEWNQRNRASLQNVQFRYNFICVRLVSDRWCMTATAEEYPTVLRCRVSLIFDLWQFLSLSCFFRPLLLWRCASQVFCTMSLFFCFFKCFLMVRLGLWAFGKNITGYHRTELLYLRVHVAFMTSHWWRWPCTWLRCCLWGLFIGVTFSPFHPLFFGIRSLDPAHNKQEENQAPSPRRE